MLVVWLRLGSHLLKIHPLNPSGRPLVLDATIFPIVFWLPARVQGCSGQIRKGEVLRAVGGPMVINSVSFAIAEAILAGVAYGP